MKVRKETEIKITLTEKNGVIEKANIISDVDLNTVYKVLDLMVTDWKENK